MSKLDQPLSAHQQDLIAVVVIIVAVVLIGLAWWYQHTHPLVVDLSIPDQNQSILDRPLDDLAPMSWPEEATLSVSLSHSSKNASGSGLTLTLSLTSDSETTATPSAVISTP